VREVLDPLPVQLGWLWLFEHEPERDGRVKPDRAPAGRLIGGMLPRQGEALAAPELGRNDDLQVRECAVLDVDRRG
jgi:hypothetical protein